MSGLMETEGLFDTKVVTPYYVTSIMKTWYTDIPRLKVE